MPRVISCTALTIYAASFLIYGCEQMPLTEGPASPVPPLGQCEPDETAAACETSCARLSACDVAPWSDEDHWACTRSCVDRLFGEDAPAKHRVECIVAAGNACCDVDLCTLEQSIAAVAPPAPEPTEPSLPFPEATTDYCEQIANEYALCDGFAESAWSVDVFVDICHSWGASFQRSKARCAVKNHGTCSRVLDCHDLPQAK